MNEEEIAGYKKLLTEAWLEINRLKEMRLPQRPSADIAITGMACRFPGGAHNTAAFWELLQREGNGIVKVPENRWDANSYFDKDKDAKGKLYTQHGGFIADIEKFDAPFFHISPKEAEAMDPQQRLLLEISWHALEDSCFVADKVSGSNTGVFIGLCNDDYAVRSSDAQTWANINAHSLLGVSKSVAAGRIAYAFGLHGPVVQLDTSCSSSLVALHLACKSLQMDECDMALAGGVNLILSPQSTISFCRLKALSADGLCKTFDQRADGYGRGEGCGVVVLKRLEDALRDNDRVLGIIRGSALNHDGYTNGMTAPSGKAQEAVLKKALKSAGIRPEEVAYVEAHGTGTSLGDPIELNALTRVYCPSSRTDQLRVGAVKTNIGHLEAAAGIAAIIKTILCLKHGQIPANLHFSKPNSFIDWVHNKIEIPTTLSKWPGGKRIAGISAFGMSGTNAHVLLQAFEQDSIDNNDLTDLAFFISAKTPVSFETLVNAYKSFIHRQPQSALPDLCLNTALGRSHFSHRIAIPYTDKETLLLALNDVSATEALSHSGKVIYKLTGQPIIAASSISEYYQYNAFAKYFDRCDAAVEELYGVTLTRAYLQGEGITALATGTVETIYGFLTEYAFFAMLTEWGITAEAIQAEGIGAYTEACLSGGLTLELALQQIAAGEAKVKEPDNHLATLVAVQAGNYSIISWLCELHCAGVNINWQRFYNNRKYNKSELPLYTFDHQVFRIHHLHQEQAQNLIHGITWQPDADLDAATYRMHLQRLEQLSLRYMLQAIQKIASIESVVPSMRDFYRNLLSILEKEALLQSPEKVTALLQTSELADGELLNTELALTQRCGEHLNDVLEGRIDPLELLFGDHPVTLPALYTRSVVARIMNPLIGRRLLALLRQIGPGKKIRILEIGAGTGGTTAAILPLLTTARVEYTFTDVSHAFLLKGMQQFSEYPFFRTALLDIEKDPIEQGFETKVYDVVIASNVLHATADLSHTLKHVRKLMSDDGTLLMWEATGRLYWLNLIAGMLDGWWAFADKHIRPDYPLMAPDTWMQTLQNSGFSSISIQSPYADYLLGQSLITAAIAQKKVSWMLIFDKRSDADFMQPVLDGRKEKFHVFLPEDEWNVKESVEGVIYFAPDSMGIEKLEQSYATVIRIIRFLESMGPEKRALLHIITKGAQPVTGSVDMNDVLPSFLWGMGSNIALEHPEIWGGMIDLPSRPDTPEYSKMLDDIVQGEITEKRMAYRKQRKYVQRLSKMSLSVKADSIRFDPNKTYLISGGTGGLGLFFSKWMVAGGAKHLVWISRHGVDTAEKIREMEWIKQAGVHVSVVIADVGDAVAMASVGKELAENHRPVGGIFHMAGFLEDRRLIEDDGESSSRVLSAKIKGLLHLHTLSLQFKPTFFIAFSSVAPFVTSPGSGAYAAASTFLDAFSYARRSAGLPALSINWGPFSDTGLALVQKASVQKRWGQMGISLHSPEKGAACLDLLMQRQVTQAMVLSANWEVFFNGPLSDQPFFSNFRPDKKAGIRNDATSENDWLQKWASFNSSERAEKALQLLLMETANLTGVRENEIDHFKPLSALGFDSLMAVEMRNALKKKTGADINAVQFLEDTSVAALGNELARAISAVLQVPSEPALDAAMLLTKIDEYSEDELQKLIQNISTGS